MRTHRKIKTPRNENTIQQIVRPIQQKADVYQYIYKKGSKQN